VRRHRRGSATTRHGPDLAEELLLTDAGDEIETIVDPGGAEERVEPFAGLERQEAVRPERAAELGELGWLGSVRAAHGEQEQRANRDGEGWPVHRCRVVPGAVGGHS
jgi:hypothetical protein